MSACGDPEQSKGRVVASLLDLSTNPLATSLSQTIAHWGPVWTVGHSSKFSGWEVSLLKKFVLCMDLYEIWKVLEGLMVRKEGFRRARQIPEDWACHTAAFNPGKLYICIVPQSPTC